jgi:hypothetical protein
MAIEQSYQESFRVLADFLSEKRGSHLSLRLTFIQPPHYDSSRAME